MKAVEKIKSSRVKIPNFGNFRFLTDVFLQQKVPPVVVSGETAYINKVWLYVLAVSVFGSEDVNVFSYDSCRARYFERLNPKRKKRKRGYRRAKRRLRWIIETRSPFAYQYEKMGAGRFGRYVMDMCLEYKVMKRMLYYFRRAAGMEKRADRVFSYMRRVFPVVRLLYPAKNSRRLLTRSNNYSGVMDFKEFDKMKDGVRFSKFTNKSYLAGILESDAGFADSPYMDTAKIYKDSYFEETPSDLAQIRREDWKNLCLYKSIRPENIG